MNLARPICVLAVAGALLAGAGSAAGQCEPPPLVKVMAPDPQPNQAFGSAVAISGGLMAVGAPRDDGAGEDAGAVYLYAKEAGMWALQKKLLAPPGAGGGKVGNGFGSAVDLKGQLLVVGAPLADDRTGAAYVFRQEGGVWKLEKPFFGHAGSKSYFGAAVAVDANSPDALLVVGEPKFPGIGAVHLFRRGNGGDWTEESTLAPLDGGQDERFGQAVDVQGDVAVVGAYLYTENGTHLGAVYVFHRVGSEWPQEQQLLAPDGFAWQGFGGSVSLSLPSVLVGTAAYDGSKDVQLVGAAYVFTDTGAGWQEEIKLESPAGLGDDAFGWSVDLHDGLALVGAPNDLAAYSFARSGPDQWNLLQTFRPDDDKFGLFASCVALGADTALFGDPRQAGGPFGAVFIGELCPPSCYADFDGDHVLTIFDFLAFVNAFNAADAAADCDGSDVLDLFDFLCFVNKFNTGC